MTSAFARRRVPRRPLVAGLRTPRGKRIGRLGLHTVDDRLLHLWEWLDEPWPETRFDMVPDLLEPAPAEELSQVYPMPPEIHAVGAPAMPRRVDRIYDVTRIDCQPRQLAVLVVAGQTLNWLEVGAGGALELAPGWLAFTPRANIPNGLRFTRRLIQRRRDRGGALICDPEAATLDRGTPSDGFQLHGLLGLTR